MEAEQGGGFEDHRSAEKTTRLEKEGAEPKEQPIGWVEVGGSSAGALQDQELVFKEQVLGEESPRSVGFEEPGRPQEQVQKQGDDLFHDTSMTLLKVETRVALGARIANSPCSGMVLKPPAVLNSYCASNGTGRPMTAAIDPRIARFIRLGLEFFIVGCIQSFTVLVGEEPVDHPRCKFLGQSGRWLRLRMVHRQVLGLRPS